jgi:excisionase family DNA binding protein
MFTIQEVADMFHVTRKTVYNWINAGRVRIIRIGGVLRIEQSEVDRIKRGEINKQGGTTCKI